MAEDSDSREVKEVTFEEPENDGDVITSSELDYFNSEHRSSPHVLIRLFGANLSSNAFIDSHLTSDEYDRFEFYRARTRSKALGDRILDYLGYFVQSTILFTNHTLKDLKSRKINFILGFLSCLILVTVCASTTTIVKQLPVIYLQLAELSAGEFDLVLQPTIQEGIAYLNYTEASKTLLERGGQDYAYTSARLVFASQILTSEMCDFDLRNLLSNTLRRYSDPYYPGCDQYSSWSPRGCLLRNCDNLPSETETLSTFLIDSDREKEIGAGRGWNNPPLGPGECYVDDVASRKYNVKKGDTILMSINLLSWSNIFYDKYDLLENHPDFYNNTDWALANGLVLELVVRDIVYAATKFPHPNIIALEFKEFTQMVADSVYPLLPEEYINSWNSSNLYHTINYMIVNLPPDRTDLYVENDYATARVKIVEFASKAHYLIGFSQLTAYMTLIDTLGVTQYLTMFLGLIINIVLVILSMLSVVLVYSLFVMSVEKRSKELGLLRMIGLTRFKLFFLLFTKSLFFGVPSVIIGLILSKGIAFLASLAFSITTRRDITSDLDLTGVVLSVSLGLLVPIISGLLPIQSALSKNVFESINQRSEKNKAVVIRIEREKKIDVMWSIKVISAGLFLSLFGFIIYFFFPLSLITLNIVWMGNIFLGILTGMLVGLAVISLNVQHILERLLVWVLLIFEFSSIKNMMLKNLQAHRSRNRKTSIMYSISISFIIFILVAYNSLAMQFTYQQESLNGAGLTTTCPSGLSPPVVTALEYLCTNSPACSEYSPISGRLDELSGLDNTLVTNIGRIISKDGWVRAVAPNLFHTTFPDFLVVSDFHSFFGEEFQLHGYAEPLEYIAELLYTKRGTEGTLLSNAYKDAFGLEKLGYPVELVKTAWSFPSFSYSYTRSNPVAFVEAAPAVGISKLGDRHDSLISYPTMISLTSDDTFGMNDMQYFRILMKLDENARDQDVDKLLNNIRELVEDIGGYVWDYRDAATALGIISIVLDVVFIFMIIMAMFICFFSILASMSTNIFEHTTELAILRSMGLKRTEAIRLYVEEAFIIILSSSILGIFSGTLVGWTMVTQSTLFTSLPVPIFFPLAQVIGIFMLSMFFAFMSTFIPSVYLLYFKGIVELHRILQ